MFVTTSTRRRCKGAGIALRAQRVPARVLISLGRIGILVPLQPEAPPVHYTLLGREALPWLHQHVRAVGDVHQLRRLVLQQQPRVRLPFGEQRKRLESRHAEWRRDPVEPEPRRPLEPRRLRRTPRPAAVDLVLVHDERQRLDVTVVDPIRDVRGGEWIRGVREEVQRVEARAAEALQADPAAVDQTATVQGIDRALVYLLIEWA